MNHTDRQILALLVADGRRTYDDIGRQVSLSAPAVKRRVDRLRATGALKGFTAVIDQAALGATTEALIELFFAPGTLLDAVAETLRRHPEVVEAWSVTGEADAIARVRTEDNADLERVIMELQREGLVERTRSQVVLSRLVATAPTPRAAPVSSPRLAVDPPPGWHTMPRVIPPCSTSPTCSRSAGSSSFRLSWWSCSPNFRAKSSSGWASSS